jgi:hypothetical protein
MSQRRRRNKKKADTQGKLLIFLASLVLLSIAYGIYILNSKYVKRDDISMCREDGYVIKESVFLIDATDSFNDTQAIVVKKELENILTNSLVDERFSLYVINEKISDKKPLFEVCNPGDGSDKSELTSNKRRLLKGWEEKFFNKVTSEIDKLIGQNTANSSPIMEAIKYSAAHSIYSSPAKSKKIYIVSDLLQHSSNYSHYKEESAFNTFKKREEYNAVRPDINNVEVEILYIYRTENSTKQNREHIMFWESFISSAGGSISRVKTIN